MKPGESAVEHKGQKMSVAFPERQVEQAVRDVIDGANQATAPAEQGGTKQKTGRSPHTMDLERQISQQLGTKVRLQQSRKKGTGSLTIDFYSLEQFDDLVKRGKVVPGSYAEYARVGNGIAVKAGAPKPDISTPEAFKRAMLAAKSISSPSALS